MIRLIVRGPLKFDDYAFVKERLDHLTRKAKDVVLISDQRIDHENSSSFPFAERWLLDRWKKNRWMEEKASNRFSTVVRHYAPYSGDKQWREGLKVKYRRMIQDATHMVVFWDVGGEDYETEAMVTMADLFDLPYKKVLI